MRLKVKEGTPLHGPPLCEACMHAHIERGYSLGEQAIFCTANYPVHPVRFSVRECSGYVDKNRQDIEAMERIAWILEPRNGKRVAGFVRPGQKPAREEDIELILGDADDSSS